MTDATCTNCGRPLGPASAHGLDARCYQYRRRTGRLPPAELLQADGLDGRATVRLAGELLAHARRLATRDGVSLSTWLRRAARDAVLREVAAERGLAK